jgi:SAM-dependent methyltransferase
MSGIVQRVVRMFGRPRLRGFLGIGAEAAVDPLSRRATGGQLRPLRPEFFAERIQVLGPLLAAVEAEGQFLPEMLRDPALANFDERVVEYPMAVAALLGMRRGAGRRLLDVGCVLNNRTISDQVERCSDSLWFWNASLEPLAYHNNLIYVIGDLRKPALPDGVCFDLVTCFSTLEHIGMDNTRYGGQPAEFEGEIADPERFASEGLRNILRYVAPGGSLLVSVPYGPFEFLYVHGAPDRPIYYTFDQSRLERLAGVLEGFDVKLSAYRVVPGVGWLPADLGEDRDMLRHAEGCASAGGVAFIEATKVL